MRAYAARAVVYPLIFAVAVFAGCGNTTTTPDDPNPNPDPDTPIVNPPTTTKINDDGPPLDPSIFAKVGDTEFLSANERELLSNGTDPGYNKGYNGRAEFGAASEDSDGQAAPGDPGVPAPEPEPAPDVTREIVEADVFKLEGDLLYVLNRYRGLVVIDVSNPDAMRIRGRLRFQAMPVEMYVRDGRAYIVSSDYFVYWQYDPDADPHGFHGSQVLIADVTNPDKPEKLGSLHVDGEVTDTRMVGDVLYAVSKRRPDYWRYNTADWEDRTWIVSLNVADPNNIQEVDRITFQGMSTLIHVAHHAIFVAAWDPNYYLTNPALEQETLVTYVDISDPAGKLRQRGKVYIPGQIADKFKMDWHEGHFRVFSQRWHGDAEISLHVVSTATPDQLKVDKTITINGLYHNSLAATRFDGARAFAFSREWRWRDHRASLYSIDLSQQLQPRVAGRIDIDINTTHIEVHGDRMLALGQHYWYDTVERRSHSMAAVGLFDVADLGAMRQIKLLDLGEGYSSTEANRDYKAFKTFPAMNLILVPLNYWDYSYYGGSGKRFAGVQLVDWTQNDLVERGRVENTGGVRRAFPVKDRLVAVGEMAIVAIDATNRDAPQVTSQLKLVHAVHDIFDVQGLQAQLVTNVYSGQVRIEVRDFGEKDDGPVIAALDLPFSGAPQVLRDGDIFHLIGREPNRGQVVRNADLTDPKNPRLRGELVVTDAFKTVFHPGWGWYYYYWSPYAGLPLRNQIIPATFREVVEGPDGRRDWDSELRFMDLRDPDNPRIATGKVPMNDFPFVNKITHGNILYSTHVEQGTSPSGTTLLYHVRSYVDRVDVTNPDSPKVLPSVNIPGYLVDVSDDGLLWYTIDFQWDEYGRRRNSLNVLRLVNDTKAELISVEPITNQVHRAALRPGWLSEEGGRHVGWNDRTIWLTTHKYPWWGVQSDTVQSRQPYTLLQRYDFTEGGAIAADQRASLHGYHFNLLDIEGSQVYLGSTGPTGLLVLDVSNIGAPNISHTARTLGYLSRIVLHGDYAYAPLGMYGVHRY